MAIIDFARVNAYQTQMMLVRQRKKSPTHHDHHRHFVSSLCTSLLTGTWEHDHITMQDNVPMVFSTNVDMETVFIPRQTSISTPIRAPSSTSLFSPRDREACLKSKPPLSKNGKRSRSAHCVICKFERNEEYKSKDAEYCVLHRVACCTKNPKRIIPGSETWAFAEEATCWDKFHSYYVMRGLFSKAGKLRSTNDLYRARQKFFTDSMVYEMLTEEFVPVRGLSAIV